MNERMRELFRQSSTEAFDHTVIGSNPRDFVCIYNKVFDPEKFAESIVKECAAYAFSNDEDYYAMLNHFGVEP